MPEEKEDASEVSARLDTHEAVCAERYENLVFRMKRMEGIMYGVAGAILLAFLWMVVDTLHNSASSIEHHAPTISR